MLPACDDEINDDVDVVVVAAATLLSKGCE